MKLLLDEMYPARLAEELRRRGHDVIAVQDRPDLRGIDDEPLLITAASEGRALVSENVADFPGIVATLTSEGLPHAGVILAPAATFPRTERGLGQLVRALDAYLTAHARDRSVDGGLHWLTTSR